MSTTRSLLSVVQAFHWKGQLEAGQFETVSELATAESLNMSYVSHVLRPTLLVPDLVDAILEGRQPATMHLQPFVRAVASEWADQRRACHFS